VDGGVVVGVVVTLEAVSGGGEAYGVAAIPSRCVVSGFKYVGKDLCTWKECLCARMILRQSERLRPYTL
jgi:hypothetical protein